MRPPQKEQNKAQKKLTLTPAMKALYFQSLDGRLSGVPRDDQARIVDVFNAQFPELKREVTRMEHAQKRNSLLSAALWTAFFIVLLLLMLYFLPASGAEASAERTLNKAADWAQWAQELRAFEARLNEEQRAIFQKLSDADKQVIMAQNRQRLAEQDTRQQAGRVALHQQDAQNAVYSAQQQQKINAQLMQQIDTQRPPQPQASAPYGYDPEHSAVQQRQAPQILTSQEIGKELVIDHEGGGHFKRTYNNTFVLPAPIIQAPPRQETRIRTDVDGIDRVGTYAVLPEDLSVDQLDAVNKIADNGTLIAQQRFGLEQYKIAQETELAYLNIVKSFTLWGFLASIPFLFTIFHIGKGIMRGLTESKKSHYAYKLKELEASERVIYDRVPPKE